MVQSFGRDGFTLPVEDQGAPDGPAVVLLHGFPGSAVTWTGVVPALLAREFRVLVPDQRGYSPGARPPGRRPYRLGELVADVVALADAAGLQRIHLAGHDWGALVAWAMAAAHPDRVASLTALATPHPAALSTAMLRGQAWRSAYIGLFWLPVLPERALLAGGGAGLRTMLRLSGLSAAWRETYTAVMSEPGALTGALGWYRALPPSGPSPAVGPVPVPTCFVHATRDATVSPAAVDRTAELVTGPYRLEVVPCSHWLPEDHPGLVAEVIAEQVQAARARS